MAYTRKYYGRHQDKNRNVVYRSELLQKDATAGASELTLRGDPLHERSIKISKGSRDMVFGSERKLSFVVNKSDISDFDTLFQSAYKDWRLDIYTCDPATDTTTGGTLQWRGYVQPEGLHRAATAKDINIVLSATDALKDLAHTDYSDSGVPYSGKQTIMQVIKNALSPLGIDMDFLIKLNTYETTQTATGLCLLNTEVDSYRFIENQSGRTKFDSCLEVLEKVLKVFNVGLRQDEGKYKIYAFNEKESYNYLIDWANLTQQSRTATSSEVDITQWDISPEPELSMIAPIKHFEVTHPNRNLGSSLIPDLGDWHPGGPWDINYDVGDYFVDNGELVVTVNETNITQEKRITLVTDFGVDKLSDEDYIKVRFSSIFQDVDYDSFPHIKVSIKKPDGEWYSDWNHQIINSWMLFESEVKDVYHVTESGNYNIKLEFVAQKSGTWSFDTRLRNVDVTKISTVGDDEIVSDVTFDSFRKLTSDADTKIRKESEVVFGDSLQFGDLGALYIGSENTELWNRYDKTDNKPIIELFGLSVISDRQRYKEFLTVSIIDEDNELRPDSVVNITRAGVTRFYTFQAFEKSTKNNIVKSRLEERIYTDAGYTITYTPLTSVDGEETQRSTVISSGGTGDVSDTERANWNTAYTQTRQWDGGSTGLVAATGRTSLELDTYYGRLAAINNWTGAVNSIRTSTEFSLDNTRNGLFSCFADAAAGGYGGFIQFSNARSTTRVGAAIAAKHDDALLSNDRYAMAFFVHPSATQADPLELALTINSNKSAKFESTVEVGNAIANAHAVNRITGDARYVEVAGDTMTGPLTIKTTGVGAKLTLERTDGRSHFIEMKGSQDRDVQIYKVDGSIGLIPHGVALADSFRVHENTGAVSIGKGSVTSGYLLDVDGKGIFSDDVLVDGVLKNQEGLSYFQSGFSAGKNYIIGWDDAGDRGYILRTYDSAGIQLALDAGGIDRGFVPGITDFGGSGWKGDDAGDFNINNLVVRGAARFRELIIDQLSIIAGSQLLSVARGKIESKSGNTVTLEDPNNKGTSRFEVGDFFWIKTVDIDGALFSDVRGQVSAISGITLTLDIDPLSVPDANGAMADISAGDVIAQRGHPTLVARQNLIYTTVSDLDSPVEKYLTGIDSLGAFDVATNVKLQLGNMSSAPVVGGVAPSGFGMYSDNAYLTGSMVLPNAGMTDQGSAATSIRMYAGDTYTNRATAPFRVQQNGKFYSTAGNIAGWEHDASEIFKTTGGMKSAFSSSDQSLYFEESGDLRTKITAAEIATLASISAHTGSGSENVAYNQSRSTASGSFVDFTATFTLNQVGISPKIRLRYTPGALGEVVSASIFVRVELQAVLPGPTIVTLGTLMTQNETVSGLDATLDTFIETSAYSYLPNYPDASYRFVVRYNITDTSAFVGTFQLGGTGSDSQVLWRTYKRETVIGRDGLYSFASPDSYLYFNPAKAFDTFELRGRTTIYGGAAGDTPASVTVQPLLVGLNAGTGGRISMKNLPTSATGLASGDIYRDGINIEIVP